MILVGLFFVCNLYLYTPSQVEEWLSMPAAKVGESVAEWTVLSRSGRRAICRCSCGVVKDVEIYTLGVSSLSCGHDRRAKPASCAETKVCRACGLEKSLDDFHKDAAGIKGRRTRCKACVKEYDDSNVDERARRAREAYRRDPAAKMAKTSAYRRFRPELGDLKTRIARGGGTIVGDVTPARLERMLHEEYENSCYICGVSFTQTLLHWDHYRPIKKGGDHSLSNLKPACDRCNRRKQARWPVSEEFLQRIAEEVRATRTSDDGREV